ncbi:MAG: energy-coupling factor ABC transporter permease [Thermodesulfobacteriota bacterium]
MHMADALISPAVGGAMWAAAAGLTIYSAKKVREEKDDRKVPLMGVMGAFVFAAQMINFTIPGTGSSGHLGGGLILAVLLGPHAAFLTMASILTVQALFFADGGLLALGCNIINLGLFPCFIAYPLIYKPLAGRSPGGRRILAASIPAAVAGLLMGAFAVVMETVFSGITELPFFTFVLLMLPIHLAIGIVEGLVTAGVLTFVWKARPEIMGISENAASSRSWSAGKVMAGILAVAVVTGGLLSWFASANPDGLEWSMAKTSGHEELASPERGAHATMAALQEKTAFLPDYGFKPSGGQEEHGAASESSGGESESWPSVSAGTTVSGLVGAAMTLMLAGLVGLGIRKFS